ncbi:winged helix-turn-helix transcriptional regulator [Micrococcales bacterium 31B]|nr:winged helix-turn-helix transcriptional regulator [Micrococcales bacterium 31B]
MNEEPRHAHGSAHLDIADFERLASLFKALASPVRLALLQEIARGERCVHELTRELQISQPLASQHLKTLRGENLVKGVRSGREMKYVIADTHITHIIADAFEHSKEAHPEPD